ncbi:ATP-dependent Clp protease adaptor protein ClpS [Serinibacter salmoneus]|uniref:ATP-dependent Clp protease adapter protein ClpS n=1 Tax=Serinibacter salmoneus TaxID=556530 RepID=A0A2A9CZW9_9MICO|nr:ATP-dependent Clp protease adaptor protein ClpS [Serinibacter salmoneus]
MSATAPSPLQESETEADTRPYARPSRGWRTVVWDDPVNLMSYVTYVFRAHFGFPRERAEELMLRVHHEGRAVVARGDRERMEADVAAMHSYGLSATLEPTPDGGGGPGA